MDITKGPTNEIEGPVTPACQHNGKTCIQNATRGFLKALLAGYGLKALGLLPALVVGKPSQKYANH